MDKLDSFMTAIKKLYYEPRMDDLSGVDQYLFATAPSVGACWFDLNKSATN